jgi:hypothetical protein
LIHVCMNLKYSIGASSKILTHASMSLKYLC